MRKTIRSSLTAFVALLMVASMATPLAAAQEKPVLTASIETPPLVKPEVESKDFDVTFDYKLPQSAYSTAGFTKSYTAVTVDHDCGTGITITGNSVVLISVDPSGGPSADFTETETYSISATNDAPGLKQIDCTLTAQAGAVQGQTVPASDPINERYKATVGYYDSMSVDVAAPIQRAAPDREVSFTLSISNFGNANSRLVFSIPEGGAPVQRAEEWKYVLPNAQVVETAIGGGNNVKDVTFTITTPARTGWNNILDGYTIQIAPQAESDSDVKGTPLTASLLIRVRGVYVPGFEAIAMLGGLLGAVAAVRRRNQ